MSLDGRHKIVTYERFKKLQEILKGCPSKFKVESIDRVFTFNALEKQYTFTWYTNQSTLGIGSVDILFTHISIDGCWPNGFRTNLNLAIDPKTTIAVIPLETYETADYLSIIGTL